MLKKGKEFIRKSNIFYDYGQNIDMVEDLSWEQKSTQLLEALVQERREFSRTEVTGNTFSELDQTTRDNMQDIPQTTDDQLHELSHTASHEVREASQLETEDLRGSLRCTNKITEETIQEAQGLEDLPPPCPHPAEFVSSGEGPGGGRCDHSAR